MTLQTDGILEGERGVDRKVRVRAVGRPTMLGARAGCAHSPRVNGPDCPRQSGGGSVIGSLPAPPAGPGNLDTIACSVLTLGLCQGAGLKRGRRVAWMRGPSRKTGLTKSACRNPSCERGNTQQGELSLKLVELLCFLIVTSTETSGSQSGGPRQQLQLCGVTH